MLEVEIITPDKTLFSGEAERVRLPGSKGSFEVLNNHAPIISSLEGGQVRVTKSDGEKAFFTISGGFVEVLNNHVIVLV